MGRVQIAKAIATGLYSGYAPAVPGTAGSALCLIIWCLAPPSGSLGAQTLSTLGIFLAGLVSVRAFLASLEMQKPFGPGKIDPGCVVIDEWLGVWISLLGAHPLEPWSVLTAFALFRIFDIIKPGPVRWAESLPREWGIMSDDIVAGALAWGVLEIMRYVLF